MITFIFKSHAYLGTYGWAKGRCFHIASSFRIHMEVKFEVTSTIALLKLKTLWTYGEVRVRKAHCLHIAPSFKIRIEVELARFHWYLCISQIEELWTWTSMCWNHDREVKSVSPKEFYPWMEQIFSSKLSIFMFCHNYFVKNY